MFQQKFCQECNQKRNCKEVYQQLGKADSPSVVFKVVAAFLLPMIVFIASLVIFDHILAKVTPHQFPPYFIFQNFLTKNWCGAKELQTALSFLLALSMAFAVVLVIKAINKKLGSHS